MSRIVTRGILVVAAVMHTEFTAAQPQQSKIQQVISVVQTLCLSGTEFNLKADAAGNLTLLKLAPSASGSVSVNVRKTPGAAAIFDSKLRVLADDKIRSCMAPYLKRIVDAILGAPPPPPPPHPAYSDAQRSRDISIIEQAVQDGGAVAVSLPPGLPVAAGRPTMSSTLTIVGETITDVTTADPGGNQTTGTARIADLSGISVVENNGSSGVFLSLQCTSGACVNVKAAQPSGAVLGEHESQRLLIPLNFDRSSPKLLELRRAFARLLSPGHNDDAVCGVEQCH